MSRRIVGGCYPPRVQSRPPPCGMREVPRREPPVAASAFVPWGAVRSARIAGDGDARGLAMRPAAAAQTAPPTRHLRPRSASPRPGRSWRRRAGAGFSPPRARAAGSASSRFEPCAAAGRAAPGSAASRGSLPSQRARFAAAGAASSAQTGRGSQLTVPRLCLLAAPSSKQNSGGTPGLAPLTATAATAGGRRGLGTRPAAAAAGRAANSARVPPPLPGTGPAPRPLSAPRHV